MSSNFSARTFYLVGSNDGIHWVLLDYENLTTLPTSSQTFVINERNRPFTHFRIIVPQTFGGSYVEMTHLQLTGKAISSYKHSYLGPTGFDGVMGYLGFTGWTGYDGLTGFTGWNGFTGFLGSSGYTGIDGTTGMTGYTGHTAEGYSGLTGITGITGYLGWEGKTGVTGNTGNAGDTGLTGTTGSMGVTGFLGVTGFTGFTGLEGITGYKGFTGLTGNEGITGASGFTGLTGLQGNSGFTGSTGDSGFSGATGSVGSTGNTGQVGYTGFSGFVGYTGVYIDGPTGLLGITGYYNDELNTGSTGVDGLSYTGAFGHYEPGNLVYVIHNSGIIQVIPVNGFPFVSNQLYVSEALSGTIYGDGSYNVSGSSFDATIGDFYRAFNTTYTIDNCSNYISFSSWGCGSVNSAFDASYQSLNYTQNPYDVCGNYVGGGSAQTFFTTSMIDMPNINGEYLQFTLPDVSRITSYSLNKIGVPSVSYHSMTSNVNSSLLNGIRILALSTTGQYIVIGQYNSSASQIDYSPYSIQYDLYLSTNYGVSFNPISSLTNTQSNGNTSYDDTFNLALSISSDGKYICAAAPEQVWLSSNYGSTFVQCTIPITVTPGIKQFSIYKKTKILSNGYIYVLFSNNLWISKNNGSSFQSLYTTSGGANLLLNDFSVSETGKFIVLLTVRSYQEFYLSVNGGTSFTNIWSSLSSTVFLDPNYNNGFPSSFYRNCEISPDGFTILTTLRYKLKNVPEYPNGFFEVIALSMDQGSTWKSIGSTYIQSDGICSIRLNPPTNDPTSINSSMLTTYNSWMSVSNCANYIFINGYVSTDKGTTFYPIYSGDYYNDFYNNGQVGLISTSNNGKYFIFNSTINNYHNPSIVMVNTTI